MTTFPEIEASLARAATRRRSWTTRPRRIFTVAIAATALSGATAATAILTTTTDHTVADAPLTVQGPAGEAIAGGRYTVKAIVTPDERACVAVNITTPGGRRGRPASCMPVPVSQPLQQVLFAVAGADDQRLLTGIVSNRVTRLDARGTTKPAVLRRFEGAPGAYFALLVDRDERVRLIARDSTGAEIGTIDTATLDGSAHAPKR